jgi:hypothetical protein
VCDLILSSLRYQRHDNEVWSIWGRAINGEKVVDVLHDLLAPPVNYASIPPERLCLTLLQVEEEIVRILIRDHYIAREREETDEKLTSQNRHAYTVALLTVQ